MTYARLRDIQGVVSQLRGPDEQLQDVDVCKYCVIGIFTSNDFRPRPTKTIDAIQPWGDEEVKTILKRLDLYGQAAADGFGVLEARVQFLQSIGLIDAAG